MAETASPSLILYHSPRACSLACAIALEASGLPHALRIVDIRLGENRSDAYLAINTSGTVPTLQIGDAILTQAHAILIYIAAQSNRKMVPEAGTLDAARAHEWMAYISTTLHMAFRGVFKPAYFVGETDAQAAVQAYAVAAVELALGHVAARLGSHEFVFGSQPGVVDYYLFVFYLWIFDERMGAAVAAPKAYAAHARRVFALPETQRALAASGLDTSYAGLRPTLGELGIDETAAAH
ncbi:MAG: glutathione S-transferase N-terminal domain-containing protein [Croceibacterium sp.]